MDSNLNDKMLRFLKWATVNKWKWSETFRYWYNESGVTATDDELIELFSFDK